MADLVQVRFESPIGSIVMNRTDRRHALSRAMIRALAQAFADLHQQKQARVVILTGAANVFCAGMDLYEIHETAEAPDATQQWHEDACLFRDLLETMFQFPKPIIAAVNGPAIGGGAGLVLASDLVIAAHSAVFAVPAPQRGLVAGLIAPLLHFRVGGGLASQIMLTGETLHAPVALEKNIFHRVVNDSTLITAAEDWARQISQGSAESLLMTKRFINETLGEDMRKWMAAGAAATATSKTTDAGREGVAAFVEGREPNWP